MVGRDADAETVRPQKGAAVRKTYILADMEGVSGIRRYEQIQRDSPDYPECRELMMGDINAAIDAAYEAGADEVVACDTHGGGGQVRVGDMDERAVYETPGGGRMMPSLDESFAGLVLLARGRVWVLHG